MPADTAINCEWIRSFGGSVRRSRRAGCSARAVPTTPTGRSRRSSVRRYGVADLAAEPALARTGYTTVFRSPYLKRTLFVGIFWTAQVIPLFALHSFAPDLLAGMGITGNTAEVFLAVLFVIGGIPGLWLVERSGRRALLLGSFGIIAVALGIPGLVPGLPTWVTFTSVYVFALASGGSSFLEVVYPNELFPTEVRATAVGVGTAFSRIGSAAATSGTPEMGGFNSRELLRLLRSLDGLNIIGSDVVEVAPAYDHAEITTVAAATVVFDLVTLMTKNNVTKPVLTSANRS
ncbi:MFS transporter [Streptomyces sp. NPDC001312]|uniref:MFS transporter n=1 Tax=Streptomyces sp. NPDC001312 TaxID=3364561 RepID=UPI003696776F